MDSVVDISQKLSKISSQFFKLIIHLFVSIIWTICASY